MTAAQLVPPTIPSNTLVLPNVTWEQFEAIDQAFESIPGVRFRYVDGALEIMPISPEHEDFKTTIRRLLEAYLEEVGIRFYSRGGPSLGDKAMGARSEPDECYDLGFRKPYPDLVIEVVISSGGVDKLEGYRRMGVLEVWFWNDGLLDIYRLRDGVYEKVDRSELLPDLPLDSFCRYITYHDQFDAVREFRQALRQSN